MNSYCKNSFHYQGVQIQHGPDGCEFAASTLCRRCHHRGHLAIDCTAKYPHFERPTHLEELIPADLRKKFNVSTKTPLVFAKERGEPGTEQEFADVNEMLVPDSSDYKGLGDFMELHNIKVDGKVTKDSKEDRIKAIKNWCVAHGYRMTQRLIIPIL